MSEDLFSQHVKSTFQNFQPEVPTEVYTKMRRKLWLQNFMSWNAGHLNIWYVSIVLTGATLWAIVPQDVPQGNQPAAVQSVESTPAVQAPIAPAQMANENLVKPEEKATPDKPKATRAETNADSMLPEPTVENPQVESNSFTLEDALNANRKEIPSGEYATGQSGEGNQESETKPTTRSIKIKVMKEDKK